MTLNSTRSTYRRSGSPVGSNGSSSRCSMNSSGSNGRFSKSTGGLISARVSGRAFEIPIYSGPCAGGRSGYFFFHGLCLVRIRRKGSLKCSILISSGVCSRGSLRRSKYAAPIPLLAVGSDDIQFGHWYDQRVFGYA